MYIPILVDGNSGYYCWFRIDNTIVTIEFNKTSSTIVLIEDICEPTNNYFGGVSQGIIDGEFKSVCYDILAPSDFYTSCDYGKCEYFACTPEKHKSDFLFEINEFIINEMNNSYDVSNIFGVLTYTAIMPKLEELHNRVNDVKSGTNVNFNELFELI